MDKSFIFIKLLKNRLLEVIYKETKNRKIKYNSKNIDFIKQNAIFYLFFVWLIYSVVVLTYIVLTFNMHLWLIL